MDPDAEATQATLLELLDTIAVLLDEVRVRYDEELRKADGG